MAYSATDSVVNTGSGRSKLPARLRAANFAATVRSAISGSTTTGVPFPKLTTTARNALTLGTGGEGTVVYDDTLNQLVLWNGSAWTNVDGTALA